MIPSPMLLIGRTGWKDRIDQAVRLRLGPARRRDRRPVIKLSASSALDKADGQLRSAPLGSLPSFRSAKPSWLPIVGIDDAQGPWPR